MKDQERVPLRIVLRNFLNHIENLESQSCPEKSYEAEFQDLKIFSENVKTLKEYSCLEGEKEVNRKKNRYKDILPFDVSRVVLNEYAGIPGSDYINANFIKGASGSPAYIASQGPLPCTVNDFWRMVVQCEVQVIVMACNEEEAGKAKCEKYWVDDGEEKQFGMISVKLLKSSTVCQDFSIRTMRLKYSNNQSVIEERTVCQLHYVAWPDHGVPTVVQPLLDMVRLVRDTQASETLPVLVHCSAGCGRTGTICAIDYVWGLLRTGKLTSDFSLLGLIREMRKQRIAMVQTKEQYVLVHQAVRELFKEQLCMIDSHPYENVDPNGLLILKDEENMYDCIEYNTNNYLEEKNDSKEKEIKPPPLPLKRNMPKFASKYEKEVENLSAQQRSMNSVLKFQSFPVHKNENRKISNDFEYDNNFEKISKKMPDKPAKYNVDKPIPSKGILRVPHLESLGQKATVNIKRSKSLKVVSNFDKNTLSFCQSNSSESKRRSSLESNFDESSIDFNNEKGRTGIDIPQAEQAKKNVSRLVSKYDIIKNQDQKTFTRSLTSVEMRTKQNYNSNAFLFSIEDCLIKQKSKLLRSNTQINVLKKNQTLLSPMGPSPMDVQKNDSIRHHNPYNKSLETLIDRTVKLRSNVGNRPPATKYQDFRSPIKRDFDLKLDKTSNVSAKKFEGGKKAQDLQSRTKVNSNNKSDQSKLLQYNELHDHFSIENVGQAESSHDKFSMKGLNTHLPNSKNFSSSEATSIYDPAKYTGSNSVKYHRPKKKIPLNKNSGMHQNVHDPSGNMHGISKSSVVHQNVHDPSGNMHGISKSSYSANRPYSDEKPRRIPNLVQDEYSSNSIPLNEDYSAHIDHKSTPMYSDHYMADGPNDSEQSWADRDKVLKNNFVKPSYSSSYVVPRSRHQHLIHKTEDSQELRRTEGDSDILHKNSMPVTVDSFNEINSCNDRPSCDISFNKDCSCNQPNDMKYILQNRRNVHQYNSSVHTSRHENNHSFNLCTNVPNTRLNRPTTSYNGHYRNMDGPSYSQETAYFPSGMSHNFIESDCFHSAPGVDLDQVAASITKDDENLMKVTLEELQVRQTKLQSAPKGRNLLKGVTPLTPGDKKKQQQYL